MKHLTLQRKKISALPTSIAYPERLSLANLPTPITKLERYSSRFGNANIWVKRDELTGLEVSGNKIRKLEFSIAEAQAQSCDTLITCGGLQSNHCRATAVIGARLGFKVHLILRGEKPEEPDGNLLMDYLCGAEISFLPADRWSEHLDLASQLKAQYQSTGRRGLFIPTGASDATGLWGYIAATEELIADFSRLEMTPDYIVCATGSGGTQAGLIVGSKIFGFGGQVLSFNVSDDPEYFDLKVRQDVKDWQRMYSEILEGSAGSRIIPSDLEVVTHGGYIGPGYGSCDEEVFRTIQEVAVSEGLFLDPVYTGKAFHGMVTELNKGSEGALANADNILFVHTGGLFGLFPQQKGFEFPEYADF